MKRQPYAGFVEVGIGPQGKQGFWIDASLVRSKTNRIGLNIGTASAVYADDNGVNVRVGDGLEVTTGSPVAVRAAPTPIAQELNVVRARITTQQQAINSKASQTALDTLSSELSSKASTDMAGIGTAGLVEMAADPGDVSTGVITLITDAATAIGLLESKINALMAAQRAAGIIG